MCYLVFSLGSTKERSGAPLEESLQSHEDHEMPTGQPGLWQTKKATKLNAGCAIERPWVRIQITDGPLL